VEYNQLDTLLRSTNYPEGDVNDINTGYSPFPGNINQLIFDLDHYVNILKETRGAMPEFVNPKYKDETKTVFKKPTRLECMMQVCLFVFFEYSIGRKTSHIIPFQFRTFQLLLMAMTRNLLVTHQSHPISVSLQLRMQQWMGQKYKRVVHILESLPLAR